VAVVVLLHLVLVLALRSGMRVRFDDPPRESRPLVVRFDLDAPTPVDPALELAPPDDGASLPAHATSRAAIASAASREPRIEARTTEPASRATSLRLFAPDGSLRLSREVLDASAPKPAPQPGYRERAPAKPIWRAGRPAVVYAPTRFERYWKPDDENIAQELVRKYPLLRLVLSNPGGHDHCPPRSLDPDCEGAVDPAFADDPYPDEEWLD
jgi:hypothetical protein